MPEPNEEFQELMRRVVERSDGAARELLQRYEPYLLFAIRRRLNRRMRSKFDSLDFAQDVWASFFTSPAEGRTFQSPRDLAAFLARVARNKVIDAVRQRLLTKKRDLQREQSLDDSRCFDKERLTGPEATPSTLAGREEQWAQYVGNQPLVYQRILLRLREGATLDTIAGELNISPRTVRRVATRLYAGWSA